ncbi:S8 family serine peptidase [Metabacillus idriensis]|uniref:S8 family serine peptidase n=1 Tax=Metabacillus idriensis TaxID=324768 RepID=A0A6I2ME95_9BACI|nr:S8 family serine peptidase [Metabacillus idriensis]MCM3597746.1 S8 family serine peptidase [Metabacillus idriensis]MRX54741.1 S8 family serine peptidase [Metabacillus idriensis]OHR68949.1 peptidase S8 [Bacillus sp. HMSC76G11]
MNITKALGAAVLSLSMSLSMFGTSAFANDQIKTDVKQESIRVVIKGTDAEKGKVKKSHQVRRDFGKDGFTTTVTQKQLEALQKNSKIKVEKVSAFKIAAGKPIKTMAYPSTRTPWGIKAIYNNSSITSTSGGDGIKIAVLDTGVQTSHIDLSQNAEQCKDFTVGTTYTNNSCTDRNGHGTHVAGSALANGGSDGQGIYGVAPQAELWAYKVLTDSGSGYSDDIAAAIRHAADEGTRTGSKVVISMSLGSSTKDSLISSAVDYAYGKGALVIAAAGNSGSGNNTIGYPGALVNAVAVAALENVQQNGTYRVANFSSRGNSATDGDFIIGERDVEISAPGAAIESTWINNGYNTISGTSMATPHVSGLAAKIWSSNKGQSNVQVRAELQRRAKLYDIKGGIGAATGDDHASGFGFARVQ